MWEMSDCTHGRDALLNYLHLRRNNSERFYVSISYNVLLNYISKQSDSNIPQITDYVTCVSFELFISGCTQLVQKKKAKPA